MDAVLQTVRAALARHVRADESLCVGLSGGLDSVVLLHALVCLRESANIRNPLSAIHVHHGLSPNAESWADFCVRWCAELAVPLRVEHVKVEPRGEGIEAAARDARYDAYSRCNAAWLLQAHHADDQVETLMLRLSRGTGLRGLAGIPEVRALGTGPKLLRPLLSLGRPQLAEHAHRHQLKWVEDESNLDARFDRNHLRLHVLPALAERFPAWRTNWTRAAAHAAEAQALLDEVAADDVQSPDAVSLERLRGLSSRRLQNALRWLVLRRGESMPDAAMLADVERRLRQCADDAVLGIRFGQSAMFHYRGMLRWTLANRIHPPPEFCRDINLAMPSSIEIPELGGRLDIVAAAGQGLSQARIKGQRLYVQAAQSGAALKLAHNRPRKSLKNLWQEAGIPPWERAWLPQVNLSDKPLWVAGLGGDVDCAASADEPGVVFTWVPGEYSQTTKVA